MKYVLFFLFFCPITLLAQEYMTCPSCGGTKGYWFSGIFMSCPQCWGRGQVVNPQYANQQAFKNGQRAATFDKAKIDLMYNNSEEAFNGFKQLALDELMKEAYFYLGACLELGMGITVDRNLAKKAYEIGQKLGCNDCMNAIKRINQNGYWQASEQSREGFRLMLKNNLDIERAATNMIYESVKGHSSSSSSSSSGRKCPSCNGSGSGTEQITYASDYTGKGNERYCSICKRTTFAHTHHTPKCPVCHGRGTVR